ncbi:uncharacterized protein LOC133785794 [Humulus lupulus]|uniref:uncharacterized protein LOC133785794 n=1 Tax=Humulus lupulus TaxID=3486 RepID=UPI002B4049A5|nr:uncharacterized protein LOC133785794 [Humulus lupulus]
MAGLKLQSMVTQLSASSKRERIGAKANKVKPQKKPKNETPVAVRRSLRTRGTLADSKSIDSDLFDSSVRSPNSQSTSPSKPSAPKIGTEFGGYRVCKEETILSTGIKSDPGESLGTEFVGDRVCKEDDYWVDMTLNPENIARVMQDRTMAVKFFPCSSSRVVVVGSNGGDVGIWNLDHANGIEEQDDGVYTYHTHSGLVSGISIH